MSYYDLFEVPDGYETDLVLLVAPYFDPKFIKMLAKKLSPEKLRIVVDDSVRFEEIKQLTKASSGIADVRIALGRAAGLVHMKGYYVEFVRSDGRSRRRRRFFYGSANAADAAFDGRWNAELIASVDLFAGEDGEFLEYLSQLVVAVENGSGDILGSAFGPLRNSSVLHLPSFRITEPGPAPGFDAWLQRELLAAKYREAQQFLAVSVVLRKPLPQEMIADVFATRGLFAAGERNVVRFRYMRGVDETRAEGASDEDD